MTDLIEKIPLFNKASLDIWNPIHIDYFINRINNNEPFSLVRFNLDAWMLFRKSFINLGYKDWPKNQVNNAFLKKMGIEVEKSLNIRNKNHNMKYEITAENFEGILHMITKPKPRNFHLSVSDKTFHYGAYPIKGGIPWVSNLIKKMSPIGEVPFNSLVWKSWAVNGQIHKLFTELKEHQLVVIGPHYFQRLKDIVKVPSLKHISIHQYHASKEIEITYKQIIDLHNKLQTGNKKVIYICEGGAPVNWLIHRLHGKLKNAYMIDVGRALDVYYAKDPIRNKTPWWQWGGWLQASKPFPPPWLNKI